MYNFDGECAVFIDIDGTLLGTKEALEQNIKTIQKFRKLGHKFFICTGRGTAYIEESLDLDKNFDGIISGLGAVSKLGDKVLFRRLMPFEVTKDFCKFVLKHDLPGVLEGEENMYYFGALEKVYNVEDERWIKITDENLNELIAPHTPIEKYTILGKIPLELDQILGNEFTVFRHINYGEVLQNNCGKGKALLETIAELGIPVERSIAIGDSMNDFDMLKVAGVAVAMGNAVDEIKQISDIITTDANDAGVSAALLDLFG